MTSNVIQLNFRNAAPETAARFGAKEAAAWWRKQEAAYPFARVLRERFEAQRRNFYIKAAGLPETSKAPATLLDLLALATELMLRAARRPSMRPASKAASLTPGA